MSSIDNITLPDGTSYELGDLEHYLKSSNYGLDDYDPDRRYRKNQAVWYKGDLYQSVEDNNEGNTPSHDSHYWIVPSIGAYSFLTEQAYSLCRNNFDIWTDTQYFIGDLVNYNGVIYEFTDNCETRDWQEAENYTRVFLGIQEGQDRDDDHNHIKWADKFLFDINITDSDTSNKIVQFDSKESYSSGTLVKNNSGRIMKLKDDYIANDPSTFSAYNATIDEILQVLLDNGGDLPSYIDIPEFNSNYTYEVGDYVKHDNNMYECISEVDTPDTWDNVSSHFNPTTLPAEVKDASDNAYAILSVKSFMGLRDFNELDTFGVGQFVIYDNSIYRCIKDHTGAWDYQDFVQYVLSPELQSFRVKTAGFGDSRSQDLYNPNNTYKQGDYCFYTNDSVRGQYSLYKCTGNNVTGTWDSSKWTKVYILDELKALASDNSNVEVGTSVSLHDDNFGVNVYLHDTQFNKAPKYLTIMINKLSNKKSSSAESNSLVIGSINIPLTIDDNYGTDEYKYNIPINTLIPVSGHDANIIINASDRWYDEIVEDSRYIYIKKNSIEYQDNTHKLTGSFSFYLLKSYIGDNKNTDGYYQNKKFYLEYISKYTDEYDINRPNEFDIKIIAHL